MLFSDLEGARIGRDRSCRLRVAARQHSPRPRMRSPRTRRPASTSLSTPRPRTRRECTGISRRAVPPRSATTVRQLRDPRRPKKA